MYLQDGLNDAQCLQQSGQRSAMKKIIYTVLLGWIATNSWASEQVCCVFDPVGTQGDISRRFQDIRLYAQQSRVQLKFKTFQISKVSPLNNKRIGILENNPPQQALVQRAMRHWWQKSVTAMSIQVTMMPILLT